MCVIVFLVVQSFPPLPRHLAGLLTTQHDPSPPYKCSLKLSSVCESEIVRCIGHDLWSTGIQFGIDPVMKLCSALGSVSRV